MKFNQLVAHSEYPWPGVLLFHASYPVINQGDLFHRISTSTHRIKNLINYLDSQFKIIDEQEFLDIASNGFKNADGKILITFDDAYQSVFTELFDFFQEKKIKPLVFFVAGFAAKTHLNWPAVVSMFIRKSEKRTVQYNNILFDLNNLASRLLLMNTLMNDAKCIPHHDFVNKLNFSFSFNSYLDTINSLYDDDMKFMSDEQVDKIIKAGWGIGSHSISHFPLTSFDDETLKIEIQQSKILLEERFSIKINSIAYPHGDFDNRVIHLCRQSYKVGFIAQPQKKINSEFEIPRFSLPGDEEIVRGLIKIPLLRKKLFVDIKKEKGLLKKKHNATLLYQLLTKEPIDKKILFQKIYNNLFYRKKATFENKGIDLGNFNNNETINEDKILDKRVLVICAADAPMRKLVSELSKSINLCGVIIQNLGNYNIKVIKSTLNNSTFSAAEEIAPYLYPYFRFENYSQRNILGKNSLAWFTARQTRVYQCSDINNGNIPPIIEKLNPDVIFVSGTRLIKNNYFFQTKVPVYNLHAGISPYYKGSNTLKWPIYFNDTNIGITVHKLNNKIDGGPIVMHSKIDLDGTENSLEIFYKTFIKEIEIISEIVKKIALGKYPDENEQNMSIGKLYLAKEWTSEHEQIVSEKLENGYIYSSGYANDAYKNNNFISLK